MNDAARAWAWRGACLLAGLAAAAAHPPYGFLPGLLGYAVFLSALGGRDHLHPLRGSSSLKEGGEISTNNASPPQAGARPKGGKEAPLARCSAFFRGWLVGVGYFALSLHWLIFPFFVDAKDQAWMAPIAVVLTVAFMALFWGAAGLGYRLLAGGGGPRPIVFAGALAGAEWLRGNLLTGFPWDLPGESWAAGSALSQTAALVGAYGLTWITLAIASAFTPAGGRRGPPLVNIGMAILALGALWLFGERRLARPPVAGRSAPLVRVVQPNVSEVSLEDPGQFAAIVNRYVALTRAPAAHPADIVLWPEGAIAAPLEDYLAPGTWTRAAVLGALRPGQSLVLGGYRFAGPDASRAYNSLLVVRPVSDDQSPIVGSYDKYRLVPFGEFMPLDEVVGRLGLKQLVHVGGGFTPGPPPRPLAVPGLPPFQPLICYEALFPGFTRQGARRAGFRAAFLVNASTDAWFGPAAGPLQHFNLARYRAIEEGLPMLRSTPTGVSAVVDALGRAGAADRLGLGRAGVIDAALPPALPPTLYERLGETPFGVMLVISLLSGVGAAVAARARRAS